MSSSPSQEVVPTKTRCYRRGVCESHDVGQQTNLSKFECIVATYTPILESLLLQLPTRSILHLYHTSRFLRSFLQSYPLAWSHLSFRLLNSGRTESRQASPASDASGDGSLRQSKQYALDQLLIIVIVPFGTRLRSLDLDYTATSGLALTSTVLPARRETLEHLSVRGCKNVSLRYHILPYLTLFSLQKDAPKVSDTPRTDYLALKSLYTFRCRHHRRRPYLPVSLLRRDSDAEPTHELVKICHKLGIWTDTAWCPTPGGRCLRRKDYHAGRGFLDDRREVWVIFDRLWRSGNRFGHIDSSGTSSAHTRRLVWESAELGHDGEPLGVAGASGRTEGKTMPAHLRRSHKIFVEGYKCFDCGDQIPERCEQCSIRMHCVGCRKTLCANCAFSRPLPRPRKTDLDMTSLKTDEPGRSSPETLWWAPWETRSPNLMMQESSNDGGGAMNQPDSSITPSIKTHWCCLKPNFSQGGGITFVVPGLSDGCASQIRAVPLPSGRGWEDAEFTRIRRDEDPATAAVGGLEASAYTPRAVHDRLLRWLLDGPDSHDGIICPRSLCEQCWQTPGWRAHCHACQEIICFAHDLRSPRMRVCGYRDLFAERKGMQERSSELLGIGKRLNIEDEINDHIRSLQWPTLMDSARYKQLFASLIALPDICDDDLTGAPEALAGSSKTPEDAGVSPDTVHGLPNEGLDCRSQTSEPVLRDYISPWRGCTSFLCPEYRIVGDNRPKCTAVVKLCVVCGVHVCPDCLLTHPACDCSGCRDEYRCPNCYRRAPAGFCKKAEDQKRRELALQLEKLADQRVEEARDFFTLIEGTEASLA